MKLNKLLAKLDKDSQKKVRNIIAKIKSEKIAKAKANLDAAKIKAADEAALEVPALDQFLKVFDTYLKNLQKTDVIDHLNSVIKVAVETRPALLKLFKDYLAKVKTAK